MELLQAMTAVAAGSAKMLRRRSTQPSGKDGATSEDQAVSDWQEYHVWAVRRGYANMAVWMWSAPAVRMLHGALCFNDAARAMAVGVTFLMTLRMFLALVHVFLFRPATCRSRVFAFGRGLLLRPTFSSVDAEFRYKLFAQIIVSMFLHVRCSTLLYLGWSSPSDGLFCIMGALICFHIAQSQVFYVPSAIYLVTILPLNFLCLTYFQYTTGQIQTSTLVQAVALSAACALGQLRKDEGASSLHLANALSERRRREVESLKNSAEAWRSAFGGMFDAVFDASCVCDAAGRIETSTPHLEQLLRRAAAAPGEDCGLRGVHVYELAGTAAEGDRAAAFLAEVARSRVAQRIQLSLRAPAGVSGGAVEVVVSGIALPHIDGRKGVATTFLGFQLATTVDGSQVELDFDVPAFGGELVERLVRDPEARLAWAASSYGSGEDCDEARSTCTAPPALQPLPRARALARGADCGVADGDCLPPESLVWVEGEPRLRQVGDVGIGQKVLCYDHLGGGLKYAHVSEVATRDAATAEWVAVVLEDGARVKMTFDHPVFPSAAGEAAGGAESACVRAGELKPGVHTLRVMKVVSVAVQEVQALGSAAAPAAAFVDQQALPSERVSISVHHPSRHSLLVASPGDADRSVALASANARAHESVAPRGFVVKNTFIHSASEEEEAALGIRTKRRCRSEAWSAAPAAAGAGVGGKRTSIPSSRASSRSWATSSHMSSAVSEASSALGPALVVIGSGVLDRAKMGTAVRLERSLVALSESLMAQRQGLNSVGSCFHEAGTCYPCLIQSWSEAGGKPCKFGFFCSRCHEDHNGQGPAILRAIGRRNKRAGARRTSEL